MPVTKKQLRWLKQRAHHLKPVVLLGQRGLTEAVLSEIHRALHDHELVKIKLSVDDRDERDRLIDTIGRETAAAPVQQVGHTATFYRPNPELKHPLELPDL